MLTKQEIRQLGTKEMTDELQKARRELLRSQFDMRTGTSKEVHGVKNLKRYVARLQTIARETNLAPIKMAAKTTTEKAEMKAKKTPAGKVKVAKTPAKKTTSKSIKK